MTTKSDHDLLIELRQRVWILERIGYPLVAFLVYCGMAYLVPKLSHTEAQTFDQTVMLP